MKSAGRTMAHLGKRIAAAGAVLLSALLLAVLLPGGTALAAGSSVAVSIPVTVLFEGELPADPVASGETADSEDASNSGDAADSEDAAGSEDAKEAQQLTIVLTADERSPLPTEGGAYISLSEDGTADAEGLAVTLGETSVSVTVDAGTTFYFGEILFTAAGDYGYWITQSVGTDAADSVTYDRSVYRVIVHVEAASDGSLKAQIHANLFGSEEKLGDITFTNRAGGSSEPVSKYIYNEETGRYELTESSAQVGDDVEYSVVLLVSSEYTNYVMHDQMVNLRFDPSSLSVVAVTAKGVTVVFEGGVQYTLLYADAADSGALPADECTFELWFSDEALEEGMVITVVYSGEILESALDLAEASNTAQLVYGDPYVIQATARVVTHVPGAPKPGEPSGGESSEGEPFEGEPEPPREETPKGTEETEKTESSGESGTEDTGTSAESEESAGVEEEGASGELGNLSAGTEAGEISGQEEEAGSDRGAQTGDDATLLLYLILAICAGGACIFLLVISRVRRREEEK